MYCCNAFLVNIVFRRTANMLQFGGQLTPTNNVIDMYNRVYIYIYHMMVHLVATHFNVTSKSKHEIKILSASFTGQVDSSIGPGKHNYKMDSIFVFGYLAVWVNLIRHKARLPKLKQESEFCTTRLVETANIITEEKTTLKNGLQEGIVSISYVSTVYGISPAGQLALSKKHVRQHSLSMVADRFHWSILLFIYKDQKYVFLIAGPISILT